MAIKGEWDVGKPYGWKKFLLAAKTSGKVVLIRYSYVSRFGISSSSLEAFKCTIFENVMKKELIGTEASVDTFTRTKRAAGIDKRGGTSTG